MVRDLNSESNSLFKTVLQVVLQAVPGVMNYCFISETGGEY